jgi:hypothetical protein
MIEVGILKNFDSGTYKAGVQLAGSLTTYFDDISVAKNIPSAAMVIGNYVIVAIPGGNPRDACVIATWPGGSPGGGAFLDLSDTPSSYSDQASKAVRVNAAETALEFFNPLWTPAIYTTQIPWVSLAGFTTSIPAGGSILVGTIAVVIKSGAVLNNNCGLYSTFGFNNALPAGKELTIEFPLSYLNAITNQRAIMFFFQYASYPPTETNRHIGFIIDNGDLHSSSADGTTQETQDTGVNLATSTQLTFCKVAVTGGVSADFYVNNVLKTTHTTHVPSAGAWAFVILIGIKTLDTVDKWMGVERIIITKEI